MSMADDNGVLYTSLLLVDPSVPLAVSFCESLLEA